MKSKVGDSFISSEDRKELVDLESWNAELSDFYYLRCFPFHHTSLITLSTEKPTTIWTHRDQYAATKTNAEKLSSLYLILASNGSVVKDPTKNSPLCDDPFWSLHEIHFGLSD